MKQFSEIIAASPLFCGISPDELPHALRCLYARMRRYKKAELILRVGASTDDFGMLLDGFVCVVREDFWGNRNLVAKLEPGDLYAEAFSFSTESQVSVDVVADSDCTVMLLSASRVLRSADECKIRTRLMNNLVGVLAEKNLRLREKLSHMGMRTTREKLLSYLSAMARKAQSNEFTIPLTRQQLADYICVERSAMSTELSKLKSDGLLDYDRNHFILLGEGQANSNDI